MFRFSVLLTALYVLIAPLSAYADSCLGTAADFNLFVKADVTLLNSDVEGSLAAGGNVFLTNSGVGAQVTSSTPQLVVGGDLTWTNGQLGPGNNIGDITVSGTATLSGTNPNAATGTNFIDFASAFGLLEQNSLFWGSLADQGGSLTTNFGGVQINAVSGLNVLSISADDLSSANFVNFSGANDAVTLINVSGETVDFSNNQIIPSGVNAGLVLYNFFEAETLTFSSFGINGSILAPFADIEADNGVIRGTVIGESYRETAQVEDDFQLDDFVFCGDIPQPQVVPVPAALILTASGFIGLIGLRRRS